MGEPERIEPGLDAEKLERLWDRFRELEDEATREGHSSCDGLFLSRLVAEQVSAAVAEERERIAALVSAWMAPSIYATKSAQALLLSIRARSQSEGGTK